VIRHDDEFVEKKFSGIAIVRECFDEQFGRRVASEDGNSLSGDCSDEEGTVGTHPVIVADSWMCCR